MIPPVMPTFGANAVLKCADMNQLRDGCNFLNHMPGLYARQGISATTMGNVVWTTVGFDTIEADTDAAMNENGTYIAQTAGWFYVTANIAWTQGTGSRGTRITVNSVAIAGASIMTAASSVVHGGMLARMVHLYLGDQLQIQGYQDTGGNLNTIVNYIAAQSRSEVSYLTMNMIMADAVQQ